MEQRSHHLKARIEMCELVDVCVFASRRCGIRRAAALMHECGVPISVIARVLSSAGPRRAEHRAR